MKTPQTDSAKITSNLIIYTTGSFNALSYWLRFG